MQEINQHIQTTLQDIYRKALDADKKLDDLQRQQQGKFAAIFDEQSGFDVKAKRFIPYVEELSQNWQTLSALPEDTLKSQLPEFVNKLQIMLKTLANFKTV